jgi:hypothetical protein
LVGAPKDIRRPETVRGRAGIALGRESESFEAVDVHGVAAAGACLGVAASRAEGFSAREAMSRSQDKRTRRGIEVAAITRRANAASSAEASMRPNV